MKLKTEKIVEENQENQMLLCENEIGTGGKGDIRKTSLEDNIILKQEIASPNNQRI